GLFFPGINPIGQARAAVDEMPDIASAEALQETFREVSARVLPSVVEITVKNDGTAGNQPDGEVPWNDFFVDPSEEDEGPRFFRSQGLGSGVIVDEKDGTYYAVTNAHVVGDSREITVELIDGSLVTAQPVGSDLRKDLAVLSFQAPESPLAVMPLADSDRLYVGDLVLAVGSPYGYAQSVSSGIVSALGRRDGPGENINDFIQTDAAINQGNSGGALVNIRGELVGINTFITTPNRGSIGLGFAIPVNNVASSVRQIIDYGEVRYGWLGVSLGDYGPEAAESLGYSPGEGAMVYQVFTGSPAEDAGLLPGDLITALNGKPFDQSDRLIYSIGDVEPGKTASFEVNRFGENLVIDVVMGTREDEEAVREIHGTARPGFVAAPLTPDLRGALNLPDEITGVPVAEVYPRTTAQAGDLRPGDLITAVGGMDVSSLESLYKALAQADIDNPGFTVWREGSEIQLGLRSGENQ
ncbi:MAG: trypsin-like peptidase domain-containing protein, partial [Spirochaetaceae bacterium]|nr:trypsin-like peptidase domain-containing protein [Spirochaetaceae bacterium]